MRLNPNALHKNDIKNFTAEGRPLIEHIAITFYGLYISVCRLHIRKVNVLVYSKFKQS